MSWLNNKNLNMYVVIITKACACASLCY